MQTWLMICLMVNVVSVALVGISSNMFFIWVALEVKLYSTLPLLLGDGVKGSFVYWFFQTIGSMLVFFGFLVSSSMSLGWLGFFLKISYFPLWFWMPWLAESLSFYSAVVVLVNNKMPCFFLFKVIPLTVELNFWVALLTFFFSSLVLSFQTSLKSLVVWSSSVKASCFFLLLEESVEVFLVYFLLYSLLLGSLLMGVEGTGGKEIMSLIFFGGVPPFVGFVYKVMLLSSLSQSLSWLFLIVLMGGFMLNFFAYMRFMNGILLQDLKISPLWVTVTIGTLVMVTLWWSV